MAEPSEPHCGKCGKVMTRENARLRPELFLHDACLPDELKSVVAGSAKPTRQTRSYQAELTALQNRVDLAIVLLRGFTADPKKGPMRVEIALETLVGTPQNGAAP